MPSEHYLSVEEVAQRLQLHVRTVRRYVRGGQLSAVRIGKQYRIAEEDLEAFTGVPAAGLPTGEALRRRHTEVVSVVQVDIIDEEQAGRLTDTVRSVLQGWLWARNRVQLLHLYDQERKRLKLVLAGDLLGVADLIETIQLNAGASLLPPPRGRLVPSSPRRR